MPPRRSRSPIDPLADVDATPGHLPIQEPDDGRFLAVTRAGSDGQPSTAQFAGSLTGPEVFSAVLRSLEQLDAAPSPSQPVTIDLRAVHVADSHNLGSLSIWMLQRFGRQLGPVRLLIRIDEVGGAMLRLLPGKPRGLRYDRELECLVVDMGTAT